MKSKFLGLYSLLFLKSVFLFVLLAFLSYRNPTYNSLVLLAVVSSIFIFQLLILLSDFTNQIRRIVWIMSYLFGLSLLININKEWFILSWKYQLIIFLFILFCLFSLRFISKVNKRFLLMSFINNLAFCVYLAFLVFYNIVEELYFNITTGLIIYSILFSLIIAFKSRISINKGQIQEVDK
jgi:hypothetical protein